MTDDPLDRIEAAHGFRDLGGMAVMAYMGALAEAEGDHDVAMRAVSCIFAGMFSAKSPPDPEDDEPAGPEPLDSDTSP